VGYLWFAIFLQLFLILGVLYTLASDSIAMNRFQISVFGAIAVVFAALGANEIYSPAPSVEAMAAGWLITAIVDILWLLYFTSEEDSLLLHIFNSFGTGGLTPPSRRRRSPRAASVHNMSGPGNGYSAPYSAGGAAPATYDSKMSGNGSFHGDNLEPGNRSMVHAGSVTGTPTNAPGSLRGDSTVGSPLMGPGAAGIGAGGGAPASGGESELSVPEGFAYKAKALYGCESYSLCMPYTCSMSSRYCFC
jgi:SHO1 osmosensor